MEKRIYDRSRPIFFYVISPYFFALSSYGLFLIAWFLPPSIYRQLLKEPDLIFMDPATFVFYTTCVVAFLVGVRLIGWLYPSSLILRVVKPRISKITFILLPLGVAITMVSITTTILLKKAPNLVSLLLSQQGGSAKEVLDFDVEGGVGMTPYFLLGTIWWAFWRFLDLEFRGRQRQIVQAVLVLAAACIVAVSVMIVSRNLIMLIAIGLGILYFARRAKERRLTQLFLVGSSATIFGVVVLLFLSFSYIRGSASREDLLSSLLGYTVASYNRLAALINGQLRYPLGGKGMYLSNFATHTRLLPFTWILSPPDPIVAWSAEFGAVSKAGLNGDLIWSGAFGYIFSDLGWFSIIYMLFYGLLTGVIWRWMKNGALLGGILYPWFGFCILFWLGTNYLLEAPLEALLVLFVSISIYERIYLKNSPVIS